MASTSLLGGSGSGGGDPPKGGYCHVCGGTHTGLPGSCQKVTCLGCGMPHLGRCTRRCPLCKGVGHAEGACPQTPAAPAAAEMTAQLPDGTVLRGSPAVITQTLAALAAAAAAVVPPVAAAGRKHKSPAALKKQKERAKAFKEKKKRERKEGKKAEKTKKEGEDEEGKETMEVDEEPGEPKDGPNREGGGSPGPDAPAISA